MSEENTNETVEDIAETVPETVVEEAAVPASLTVQDLANIRNIIDVASQRGTFKPAEFSMVGDAYTKLNNFITAITPPAPEGGAPEAEAPVEAEAAE